MSDPQKLLERLNQHRRRIQRMLQPGKSLGSEILQGYSPVSERIGGRRFLQSAREMQSLHKDKIAVFNDQPMLTLGDSIADKFSGISDLVHFSPAARQSSSFWREVDQVDFNQVSGSREEPAQTSRPGDLRAGSVIQSMSMFPKPGQSLEDFQRQSQGQTIPKRQPPKPATSAPVVRSQDRMFARVEEISATGRKTSRQQDAPPAPPSDERQQSQLPDSLEPEIVDPPAGEEFAAERTADSSAQEQLANIIPDEPDPEAVDESAEGVQESSPVAAIDVQPAKSELKKAAPVKKPASKEKSKPLLKAKPKVQRKTSGSPTVQRTTEPSQSRPETSDETPRLQPGDLPKPRQVEPPEKEDPLPGREVQPKEAGIEAETIPVRPDTADAETDLPPREMADQAEEYASTTLKIARPVMPQDGDPEMNQFGTRVRSRAELPLNFSGSDRQAAEPQLVDKNKYAPNQFFPRQTGEDRPAERRARQVIQPEDTGGDTQRRWSQPLELTLPAAASGIQDPPALQEGPPNLQSGAVVSTPQTVAPPAVQKQTPKPQTRPAQPLAAAPVQSAAAPNVIQRLWPEHAEPQGGSAGDAGNAQPETDNTKIDLDELAQEIYPIVKQLLEFEAERLSGKFK